MKKLLAILLSTVLLLGVTVSAFAVETDEETEIDEVDITIFMPLCGAEVTGDNLLDVAEVAVETERVRITELEMVKDFDEGELTAAEPFSGTIEGDQDYAFLMTLETEEGYRFADEVCWGLLADGDDIFISILSDTSARLAVVCTAEHDWGEWVLTEEPTEDEDGEWTRVCLGDPDHVETEIAPAGEDPVEPGTVGPVLHEIEAEIYAPVCGNEITDENRQDAVWVYYYPEDVIDTEHCELVTDYDPEDPTVFTPFLGTVIGGEEYTALLTIVPNEEHSFAPNADIGVTWPEDASFEILEQTEDRITLAITFTADHDWGEWYVETEPTEEEDGLWMRVCQYDPDHVEAEVIPATTEGDVLEMYLDLTFPLCGDEVDESYAVEDETVYLYGDGGTLLESRFVSAYDPEHPEEAEPFAGTAMGGESYTFLLWLECGDRRQFNEETAITVGYPYDAELRILEMTEHTAILAVTAAAEHDWGEWYVEKQPTEDEDGLWMRVCQYDPDHVETDIIPAGTEPVYPEEPWDPGDPGDWWDTDDPELFAATIEVMPPVCGDVVTEDNRLEAVGVYPWPENAMVVEHCELVTDYDAEDPAVFTPFLGTVIGGEEYTFLMTLVPDEDHWFGEDMAIDFYEPYLYSWEVLSRSEREIILAVTFTADHDWGDWHVETEPTEDEDGLWMRECRFNPDHVETQIIPAGSDPYAPFPDYGPVAADDCPAIPGCVELDKGAPNTDDPSKPVIWCATAVLSLAGAATLMVRRKKRAD